MKTYTIIERPAEPGENPQPIVLAQFILWKFLQMPSGGLYAKWDFVATKAVWFFSEECDYMFREPRQDAILYEEHDRSRFRSLVFRFGSLGSDDDKGDLCGFFGFSTAQGTVRRFAVHSSFRPENGIGLWIAMTPLAESSRTTPTSPER